MRTGQERAASRARSARVIRHHARRGGRPRSAEVDGAILDATAELFIERGWDGVTMEGVATRAGVGKAAIYRRYEGKLALVTAAAAWMGREKGAVAPTGSLHGDVRALAGLMHRMLVRTRVGRAIPVMIAAGARNPELARAHRRLVSEGRDPGRALVRAAIERGELGPGTDVEAVLDAISGPIFYRVYISGERVDRDYLDALAARVVAAFAP